MKVGGVCRKKAIMEVEEVTLGSGPHVIEGGYEASHQPRRATQMFFDQDQRHRWRLSEIDTPHLTPLPINPPTFPIPKFECGIEVVRFHPQHTREMGNGNSFPHPTPHPGWDGEVVQHLRHGAVQQAATRAARPAVDADLGEEDRLSNCRRRHQHRRPPRVTTPSSIPPAWGGEQAWSDVKPVRCCSP
ncbi:hypothetical protein C0Q70_16899 [Pomacea canaliculata]|uniref:Uncharacterized protein n=1 Tax=Pomacea canaliculata TaxID=400727 RepID=A0A2T7NR37_POMCA|nr:hypothetical protein C0Q70_16899 [Pomacea canaliculata]